MHIFQNWWRKQNLHFFTKSSNGFGAAYLSFQLWFQLNLWQTIISSVLLMKPEWSDIWLDVDITVRCCAFVRWRLGQWPGEYDSYYCLVFDCLGPGDRCDIPVFVYLRSMPCLHSVCDVHCSQLVVDSLSWNIIMLCRFYALEAW